MFTIFSFMTFSILSIQGFLNTGGLYSYFFLPWYFFGVWLISAMWLFHVGAKKIERKALTMRTKD